MQVCWEQLTPPDFRKLATEEKLCILPIGCMERHGDHMPFGTDGMIAHDVSVRAAQMEPCVVFPTYWFGQVHEATCHSGAINFPTDFVCTMLEQLLQQISQNGFSKILIVNAHGGNTDFLRYFLMSQCDREVDYTLYSTAIWAGDRYKALDIFTDRTGGHADEEEACMTMAIDPETVKMEYQTVPEPVLPKCDLKALDGRVYTGLWWFDKYPKNVTGSPSFATAEKGEIALKACALDLADIIRAVKEDEALPALQKEFWAKKRSLKEGTATT